VKLVVNLGLSLAMLALCAYLMWPDSETRGHLSDVIASLELSSFAPYLVAYIGLLVVVQVCRSLRWNNLLAPLGVRVPIGPLLAISSVGFMAILALPARLGELVRPGLLRQRGEVSASAALGTLAIERIVDGLMISLFVFGALFSLRGPDAPGWMMPTAYAALCVFVAALVFVVFAMWRPQQTIAFCVRLTLLPRFAPRLAVIIEAKLLDMVRGFVVLRDSRNMLVFVLWSLAYWGANGVGLLILAHAFGLNLSIIGAFATMGVVGVGIMLPNSPGLVGQFQWFTLLGLSLYLGPAAADKQDHVLYPVAFAFANLHYILQVGWYVLCGALGLATPWVSFHDLRVSRKVAREGAAG
jgi:glycosyltransferase 2 family protein